MSGLEEKKVLIMFLFLLLLFIAASKNIRYVLDSLALI